MNEGEPVQLWMQTFIDDYIKDNPGSKVNVTWCGREVLTKLQARMVASVDENFLDIVDPIMAASVTTMEQCKEKDFVVGVINSE